MTDVVITGIGIISPFGVGKSTFFSAVKQNRHVKTEPLPEFKGTTLETFCVGSAPNLDEASKQLKRKHVKFMSDAALIGCLAGKEAAEEAKICDRFEPARIGIYSATGLTAANINETREMLEACMDAQGNFSETLFGENGLGLLNPLNSFKILPNMPPCILSIILGVKGCNMIFNPWEDQAAAAVIEGFRAVKENEVDCALVGAADTPAAPPTVVYLKQKNLLGKNEFPSSAGVYLVFESIETAARDGVPIYAVIKDIHVKNTGGSPYDPLSENMGRTFAVSPPLLMARACTGKNGRDLLVGTRGTEFKFNIETGK